MSAKSPSWISQYIDADELKRLLSTLLVFIGAIVIFALFAGIVVPGLRNANEPADAGPVTPVVGESGWLDPAEFPPMKGYDVPPVDPKTLIEPSPALLARGKEIYGKSCVQCHGESGRGDGPSASSQNPRPRNFTVAEGWKNGFGLSGIAKTLENGIPGSGMQSFLDLPVKDRMAAAHHVQSLGSFPHADDAAALEALSKKIATGGERVPNRIPATLAAARIIAEFKEVPPLDPPAAGDAGPGAGAFRKAIADPARAALALAAAPSWRKGPEDLARAAAIGAPGNGFAVAAATLSLEEWRALHDRLSKGIGGSR
jgi:mono/diheme cytochrome c family protein